MIQKIIALSIVAIALGYTAYSIYRIFAQKKGNTSPQGCAGCHTDCRLRKNE